MSDLRKKRIITAALCGSWPTKDMNPAVPYTPEEIAREAYSCWKAGAAIVHIHAREADGSPSIRYELYEDIVNRIRAHEDCDVCINITSSGRECGPDEERIEPIHKLLPELCSYDAGTLNWQNRTVFENHPRFLEKLGYAIQECNVKPEIEIFDAGMIYNTIYYMKKGVLKAPCHYQIVLGCAGGMTSTVENLVHLRSIMPEGSTWAACGISSGHLRVGLEDNLYLDRGVLAKSNVDLVERAVRALELNNLEPATPDEAREILGLTRQV